MATKVRETESYELYQGEDGKFSAILKGGIAAGTGNCESEIEAVEQLLIGQRDLVNQRNDEQKRLRAALPQGWLSDLWKFDEESDQVGVHQR